MPWLPGPSSSSASGVPLWRSLRAPLRRRLDVRPEGPGATTCHRLRARRARTCRCEAGQFFIWRFLDGTGWSRGQPLLGLRRTRRLDPAPHRGAPRRRQRSRWPTLRPGHAGARRGPLRPDAPGRAHAPQGAAHGRRHRHRAAARPARGPAPGTRATSPSSSGPAHGTGSCSPTRSAHWPQHAAPVTSSSRAPACRAATAGCQPRRRHLSDAQALLELVPDVADHDVFLCGAPDWMDGRPHGRPGLRRPARRTSTSSASPTSRPGPVMRRITLWLLGTITSPGAPVQLPHVHLERRGRLLHGDRRPGQRLGADRRRRVLRLDLERQLRPEQQRLVRVLVGFLVRVLVGVLVGLDAAPDLGRREDLRRRRGTDPVGAGAGPDHREERQDHRLGCPAGALGQPPRPGDQLLRRAGPQQRGRRPPRTRTSTWSPARRSPRTATSSRCSPRSTRPTCDGHRRAPDRRVWVEQIMGMPISRPRPRGRADARHALTRTLRGTKRLSPRRSPTCAGSMRSSAPGGPTATSCGSGAVSCRGRGPPLARRRHASLCAEADERTGGLFTAPARRADGRRVFDPTGLVKGWAVEGAARHLDARPTGSRSASTPAATSSPAQGST